MENEYVGPKRGEEIRLGTARVQKVGSSMGIVIRREIKESYSLQEGEVVDVVLTRRGMILPKQNRKGSPLLNKQNGTEQ